jgi:carboxypeptidase C (cathepsin A)
MHSILGRYRALLVGIVVGAGLIACSSTANAQRAGRNPQSATTAPAPAQTPESAMPEPGSRRGRGGRGGLTVAPTQESVDETPVVTHHTITLDGKELKYTATIAQMPLKTASGETEAHIFYMAYTLDDTDHDKRPLTFAFNGGPGSASIWVHMGAMGPKRAKLDDDGNMPAPPFKLVDNDQTWLQFTDLVFIDPVGTGFSRAKSTDVARRMNGVQGDLQSVTEFIRMYLTRNDRFLSPLFVAGESYGTFRAAGLAGTLLSSGFAVNGIVLISTILDYGVVRPNERNSTAYALHLPTYTADAWYHKKLDADLQNDLQSALRQSEKWAMGGYLDALNKGDTLSKDERDAAIKTTARLTGLSAKYVDQSDLRIDVGHFTRELLRDDRLTIGRYDGRITGPSPMDAGEAAESDPSDAAVKAPFTSAFLHYIRSDLKYQTDETYYALGGGIMPWDFGRPNSYAETTSLLQSAFTGNAHLKVLVCASYFDLATPYFSAQYTLNHMGIHPDRQKDIKWAYYESGHMMYIEKSSRAKLHNDVKQFVESASPKSDE